MEKVIRNGKVAVLISPSFGAGWSTWNTGETAKIMLFHPKIVEMVEQNRRTEITEEWLKDNCGITDDYVCILGSDSLKIEWILEGAAFSVEEYDGSESIRTVSDLPFTA
jgi:hypothetical protein